MEGVKMLVKGSPRRPHQFAKQAAHVPDEKTVSRVCCTDVRGEPPGPRSRLGADISWDEETPGHGMMAG